jgi:hypothetical protein
MKKLLLALMLALPMASHATNDLVLVLDSVRHYDELGPLQGPESFHQGVYLNNLVGHTHKCVYMHFTVEYDADVLTPIEFVPDENVTVFGGIDMNTDLPFGGYCSGTGGSTVLWQIASFGEQAEGLYLPTNTLVKVGDIVWHTVEPDPPSGGWQGAIQLSCLPLYNSAFQTTDIDVKEADGSHVANYNYGTAGFVILNSCVRWFDNNLAAPSCPQGAGWEPCGRCPPEVEEKVHIGVPARTPHREDWTDVAPSPWGAIKRLYR